MSPEKYIDPFSNQVSRMSTEEVLDWCALNDCTPEELDEVARRAGVMLLDREPKEMRELELILPFVRQWKPEG